MQQTLILKFKDLLFCYHQADFSMISSTAEF